jgi:hypothetical protein
MIRTMLERYLTPPQLKLAGLLVKALAVLLIVISLVTFLNSFKDGQDAKGEVKDREGADVDKAHSTKILGDKADQLHVDKAKSDAASNDAVQLGNQGTMRAINEDRNVRDVLYAPIPQRLLDEDRKAREAARARELGAGEGGNRKADYPP